MEKFWSAKWKAWSLVSLDDGGLEPIPLGRHCWCHYCLQLPSRCFFVCGWNAAIAMICGNMVVWKPALTTCLVTVAFCDGKNQSSLESLRNKHGFKNVMTICCMRRKVNNRRWPRHWKQHQHRLRQKNPTHSYLSQDPLPLVDTKHQRWCPHTEGSVRPSLNSVVFGNNSYFDS